VPRQQKINLGVALNLYEHKWKSQHSYAQRIFRPVPLNIAPSNTDVYRFKLCARTNYPPEPKPREQACNAPLLRATKATKTRFIFLLHMLT
jgi:hypothetical protein